MSMCSYEECLTDGDIRDILQDGWFVVKAGYIDGKPFSALVIDKRSGEHLHFPYRDVMTNLQ